VEEGFLTQMRRRCGTQTVIAEIRGKPASELLRREGGMVGRRRGVGMPALVGERRM